MEKKILFYEWSDIIHQYDTIYAICAKGKSEIVLSGDYKNLRKNFSKHNKE